MNENTKIYYSISEVCGQTGLEPHVLRYWESEFPQLHPKKNRAGNRAYREKDIRVILDIQRLLYEEKFTIPGARKKLGGMKISDDESESPPAPELQKETKNPLSLQQIREELGQLLSLLKG